MKKLFITLVRGYQLLVSPFLGNNCRFYPSCSQYMIQAIEAHGIIKGVYLGLKRLSKCHPWHEGGIDPVPPCHCHTKGTDNQEANQKTQNDNHENNNHDKR
ncbi:membrane protein insertion efficiency factor YidD [Marinomonas sp. A79]|uniref:Putative membrane protein insertion efficiency factor n=1 Tax=Marinomonas vulgaris TaxID=2823372 RepID=A0ABS5HC14_9GAMM|nr:membrane protein insertion efficiency factor YidD [Marinomonas vulgaris]MBR7889020.1 membrane protein insertion efficiency factor YidD [Marinomonas vulgaris]